MEIVMKNYILTVIIAVGSFEYVMMQGGRYRTSLLCANKKTLRKVDLVTNEYIDIVTNIKAVVALDYHYQKNIVFWTDIASKKIYSFVLGSADPITEIVDACLYPSGVAVDWIHDNLYWTDRGKHMIGVAHLDGRFVKTLFHRDILGPGGIVVDPIMGLIFWTDTRTPKIERSGTDGTHRTVIVSNGIMRPNALTIDLITQSIYWADETIQEICKSSYSGTDVSTIITVRDNTLFPKALDILEDWLYFNLLPLSKEKVYKCNKYGLGNISEIIDVRNWSSILSMKVYDSSKQITGVNRCIDNGGCSHLCLPAPILFSDVNVMSTCLCPDHILPKNNCSTIPIEAIDLEKSTTEQPHFEENVEDSFLIRTIIEIFLGIVILAFIIFYLYKKISRRTQPEVNKSEDCKNIKNPIYSSQTEENLYDLSEINLNKCNLSEAIKT